MTRKQLRQIINDAHTELHNGNIEAAHEILHMGYGDSESMTCDPEVQQVVREFNEYMAGKLPCGHTVGDLVSGKGSITKCGACLQERGILVSQGRQ